jgi:hypothetical protein
MPRIKPTTVFTPRTKPTTEYTKPRDRSEYPVSFDSVEITFDSTVYTWDLTFENLWPLTTIYTTPRKIALLELENWLDFVLESWEVILLEWGAKKNIINTNLI